MNSSPDTKIAVIADADIIRNDVKVRPEGISISPLGYDKFTSQTFGNKDFVRNLVSHSDRQSRPDFVAQSRFEVKTSGSK